VVFNDDHFGTSMPGAGAVHVIKKHLDIEQFHSEGTG
jgi:hypothetical protein